MNRVLCSMWAAFLALFAAKAMGVPFWRDGWDLSAIGDQADFAVAAFFCVWCGLGHLRAPPVQNGADDAPGTNP